MVKTFKGKASLPRSPQCKYVHQPQRPLETLSCRSIQSYSAPASHVKYAPGRACLWPLGVCSSRSSYHALSLTVVAPSEDGRLVYIFHLGQHAFHNSTATLLWGSKLLCRACLPDKAESCPVNEAGRQGPGQSSAAPSRTWQRLLQREHRSGRGTSRQYALEWQAHA